jgi:CRISPR-associated protein Cas5t
MKALRVELYQDHVCYRQEAGYRFYQSYPLPTPSMVRGLVHRLMGCKSGGDYIPLRIGIQGKYESLFVDMQRWVALSKKRFGITVKGDNDHSLYFWEELAEVNLTLYITFKANNDENLEKLYSGFIGNTVVLGRNEDIARLDKVEIVELTEAEPEVEYNPKQPIYIKISNYNATTEISAALQTADSTDVKNRSPNVNPVFHLPFAYVIKGGRRIFKYTDACLATVNMIVEPDYLCGSEPVFLLELNAEDEKEITGEI